MATVSHTVETGGPPSLGPGRQQLIRSRLAVWLYKHLEPNSSAHAHAQCDSEQAVGCRQDQATRKQSASSQAVFTSPLSL